MIQENILNTFLNILARFISSLHSNEKNAPKIRNYINNSVPNINLPFYY
jgi:hypothetical protein